MLLYNLILITKFLLFQDTWIKIVFAVRDIPFCGLFQIAQICSNEFLIDPALLLHSIRPGFKVCTILVLLPAQLTRDCKCIWLQWSNPGSILTVKLIR